MKLIMITLSAMPFGFTLCKFSMFMNMYIIKGEIEEKEYDEADNDYAFCDALEFYIMQI